MKKNDIYKAEITAISAEGMGICKIDGMTVFVGNTTIGDVISCRIVKVLKNYCFGIADEILQFSENRQNIDCKVFGKCGGCVFRHINYSFESQIKQQRVQDAIERIGGYKNFKLENIDNFTKRDRYRNKAQLPFGIDNNNKLIMGFYGKHSHRIVCTDDCLLQPVEFTKAMDVLKAWHEKFKVSVYNEETHKGLLRHLYLRMGEISNEIMVCIIINGKELPHSKELCDMLKEELQSLTSFVININTEKTNVITGKKCITLFGKDYIKDELCGLNFNVSPLSFFQVNRTQAQHLYEKASEYANLTGEETLLDLYCGAGTIGLSMAKKAKKVIGVEIIPQAIENAKINAQNNDIKNATFFCADASSASITLKEKGEQPDVIILDPPRKGVDKTLIDTVSEMSPKRIVYISCDPATFARDIKIFADKGYILKKAKPYDLFPATAHCEVVSLLEKE